jgi:hypothetical protein
MDTCKRKELTLRFMLVGCAVSSGPDINEAAWKGEMLASAISPTYKRH